MGPTPPIYLHALEQAVDELRKLSYIANCRLETSKIHIILDGEYDVAEIVGILSGKGVPVEEIKRAGASLEEIYTRAVRETER